MAKKETFLNNVDVNKVQELLSDTDDNVEYFNSVATQTANRYTEHLDKLMQNLYKLVMNLKDCPTDKLEKYYLGLGRKKITIIESKRTQPTKNKILISWNKVPQILCETFLICFVVC